VRTLLAVMLLILSLSSQVWAQLIQTVEISSSPNPVGSGARALGMGGAFIGVADDATAASWNPAGLIQLETPEVSIVGAYNKRTENTTYTAFPEASGPQSTNTYEINYLSAVYPFTALNRNMVFSLNFQHLYDFNKKVNFSYTFSDTTGPPLSLKNNIQFDQEGAFKSLSPAFAFQITPFSPWESRSISGIPALSRISGNRRTGYLEMALSRAFPSTCKAVSMTNMR
jgi:long-subunit fatty acid transport protein